MSGTQRYLTIDIGGTVVKYSLFNGDYEELECGEEPTRKDPEQFLKQLLTLTDQYRGKVAGLGICMGGFIDPATGENRDFSVGENFRAWNLKKELYRNIKVPVILENDSNCAALGELEKGAGRGFQDFALLTIGTGVGGALVLGGKLIRGSHFKAAEAGLMLLGQEGSTGGYETVGATSVLVRKVSEKAGVQADGHYVFDHLDNPDIGAVYEGWLERIALAAGNLAVLMDPEAVLIGGGICRQERFIRDLRERIYALFPHLEEYTRIEACKTGNLAGRIGALRLLLEELEAVTV